MANLLVVDDDPDIRAILEITLRRKGHRVTTAAESSAAVNELKAGTFDLILLDIDMPGMDGLSLARLLRENPRFLAYRPVPIVVMTGKDDPGIMGDSFDAGAIFFLPKPFAPMDAAETVRMVLESL